MVLKGIYFLFAILKSFLTIRQIQIYLTDFIIPQHKFLHNKRRIGLMRLYRFVIFYPCSDQICTLYHSADV